jgi:hypothetical protein
MHVCVYITRLCIYIYIHSSSLSLSLSLSPFLQRFNQQDEKTLDYFMSLSDDDIRLCAMCHLQFRVEFRVERGRELLKVCVCVCVCVCAVGSALYISVGI